MKQTAKIFLCYARKDAQPVSELYQQLMEAGLKPFMDTKDILPGEDWKKKLIDTIRGAPFFLACLSKNSVDRRGVIQEEIREALEVWRQKLDSDIYFIPVRLEDCAVPGALAKFQWVDLFQTDGFERLKLSIDTGLERLGVIRSVRLRSEPVNNFSQEDVKLMLRGKEFFASDWNWTGKGLRHHYELVANKEVVIDHSTDLVWQQSGSLKEMAYTNAEKYICDLNEQKFAGYTDWRLPTLEEAMSLMEPKEFNDDLHVDPIFDSTQGWIWTGDKERAGLAWIVLFHRGLCLSYATFYRSFVRGVR